MLVSARGARPLRRHIDQRRRDVDTHRTTNVTGRPQGRLPGPATDVEHRVPGTERHRTEQGVGERCELTVVAVDVVDVVHRLGAVPCLGLLLVRSHAIVLIVSGGPWTRRRDWQGDVGRTPVPIDAGRAAPRAVAGG